VHRLHTEPDFKEAWELTDGRFQVYVCDGCVETRNRTLCTALSERDAALIAKALTAYLDALWGKP
jgi:hypothetical protein